MGCCISKCRPKSHCQEQDDYFHVPVHVQDKGVISQAPTTSSTQKPQSKKILRCPTSPSRSASSASSFTLSSSSNVSSISSASSLSSSSSSAMSSLKERSYSNEFLWSCAKENSHIIQVDSIKASPLSHSMPTSYKSQVTKLDSPAKEGQRRASAAGLQQVKQSSGQRVSSAGAGTQLHVRQSPGRSQRVSPAGSRTLQKRASPSSRSPSPLTRQKSFRKEPDYDLNTLPSGRTLRSPSPSRRFTGDSGRDVFSRELSSSKRSTLVGPKTNAAGSLQPTTCLVKRESLSPASPSNNRENHVRSVSPNNNTYRQICPSPLNAQTRIHRVGSKIDQVAVEEAMSCRDINSPQPEDMNNPLIALDCFIFL